MKVKALKDIYNIPEGSILELNENSMYFEYEMTGKEDNITGWSKVLLPYETVVYNRAFEILDDEVECDRVKYDEDYVDNLSERTLVDKFTYPTQPESDEVISNNNLNTSLEKDPEEYFERLEAMIESISLRVSNLAKRVNNIEEGLINASNSIISRIG